MNASSIRDIDVLIVGAGPTGLVLALWLTRLGVRVRIVDKAAEPGTTSRAIAVQARTLESWVKASSSGVNEDNFKPLTSLDWQVHVYGDATPAMRTVCDGRKLPLHVFPWRPETGRTGLRRNAVYLVRPDGYVALADPEANATVLTSYLDQRKLTCQSGN